jgi:acetylornithine deacetylase/succinyl-diaminopimelate desuccinylase-like protein
MRAVIGDDQVTVAHVAARPGETAEAAESRVAKGIAATPSPYPDARGGPADPTGVFAAWEAAVASVYPGVPVTPTLFEAGTASGAWRAKGIPVYGLYPYVVDDDALERMHGNDERVRIEALRRGSDLMYALFGRFRV